MIYLTGDTHIPIDIIKLSSKNFPVGKTLTKDDYVIVLGDFGLYWKKDKTFEYWHNILQNKPWTILWLDGNHENHDWIDSMEVSEWHRGKVHKDGSIIHLMRGQIYEIEKKKIFVMGGADSVDKNSRTPGVSWWAREVPNYAEINEAIDNLMANENSVDYVLTHTCPKKLIKPMFNLTPWPEYNNVEKILQTILGMKINFRKWYFGHWHQDVEYKNFVCLYDKVIKLEESL